MEKTLNQRKAEKFIQAIIFGLIFGFLLQKGGVAKYNVLQGQLLLQDFTVVKVMLSAIVVAMIGILIFHKQGKIKLHIRPTKIGANVIGGLVFGVGFALSGYCPGTGAAALGQGDFLVIIFMLGMVTGSYLFAEASAFLKRTVQTWGDKGKITLNMLLAMNKAPFAVIFSIILISLLTILK